MKQIIAFLLALTLIIAIVVVPVLAATESLEASWVCITGCGGTAYEEYGPLRQTIYETTCSSNSTPHDHYREYQHLYAACEDCGTRWVLRTIVYYDDCD